MTEQTNEPMTEDQEQQPSADWGRKLARTRSERGLELETVAAELRLDLKLLQNIEREDQSVLPVPSFVKGYLRSYARYLDLDPTLIIAAYDQVADSAAPSIRPTRSAVSIQPATSRDSGPRTVTILLVTVLVVSFLVWWGGTLLTNGTSKDTDLDADLEQAVSGLALEPAPMIEQMQTPADAPVGNEETAPSELEPVVDEEVAVEMPADNLVLEFSADAWVEIIDAEGARVFFDLGKAGQRYQSEGKPPFKIVLGNAPAVTLYHNGERIDHARYNEKGVAKFTLGE